jgi:hypothetical protein
MAATHQEGRDGVGDETILAEASGSESRGAARGRAARTPTPLSRSDWAVLIAAGIILLVGLYLWLDAAGVYNEALKMVLDYCSIGEPYGMGNWSVAP